MNQSSCWNLSEKEGEGRLELSVDKGLHYFYLVPHLVELDHTSAFHTAKASLFHQHFYRETLRGTSKPQYLKAQV